MVGVLVFQGLVGLFCMYTGLTMKNDESRKALTCAVLVLAVGFMRTMGEVV